MAYTNAPNNSTYKPVKIKFDGTPYYRAGNLTIQKDCNIINFYYDRVSQENKEREVSLKKRPGLAATGYSLSKSASSAVLRGFYNDTDANAFYWAVDDKVYRVAPDVGTAIRTVQTLTTSSGYVGFCSYLTDTNTKYIIFSDGTDCYFDNYVTTTCTEIVDADMPTPHVPCPIYLDGYLFLADANTSDLYNSNVNDPAVWTAGDYISAEMSADYIIKLALNRNYIIAFGKNSMEVFWDAANATGSPLARNESYFKNVGYITGLAQIGDVVIFIGQDQNKNIGVYQLEGFKLTRISNEVVDRTIQSYLSTNNIKSQTNLNKDGLTISVDGHTFYSIVTSQTTWLWDVDEKIWYEWRGSDDTYLKLEASWTMYNGAQYCAIGNQSNISILSPSLYQDFSSNFTCQYTTEHVNFDTMNWKTCARIMVDCDQEATSGTSNLTVAWSDSDWADGGTTPRNINVFSNSPFLRQCGRFRTRSLRLKYADNYPLRIKKLELDINVGNT